MRREKEEKEGKEGKGSEEKDLMGWMVVSKVQYEVLCHQVA